MLTCQSLRSIVILGSIITSQASPVVVIRDNLIRLPLAKNVNVTSPQILENDQARAAALVAQLSPGAGGIYNVSAVNRNTFYSTQIYVGCPGVPYNLLIDVGSSNTFVGAGLPYVRTPSSIPTGDNVSQTYAAGFFKGVEYYDSVSLGTLGSASALTIANQSIGAALESKGFNGLVDGILGLGPVGLSVGTLSPHVSEAIPTVTDNLFRQGKISAHEVAISFNPQGDLTAGELTFGGTDSNRFTGAITYAPITATSPSSMFWGIDQSIKYGDIELLSDVAGIVDTGTSLLLITDDAFQKYETLTGAVSDEKTGLLQLSPTQFKNLKSLYFDIHGTVLEFVSDAQVWPRALNSVIGGVSSKLYLIVNTLGNSSEEGFKFINGLTWLERFYSVYDTAGHRVGIANTPNTQTVTNSI